MAVPADASIIGTFQDIQGFKSQVRIDVFLPDITGGTYWGNTTLASINASALTGAASVLGRLASMSNAKLVETSFTLHAHYAQEPTTESGQYRLTRQKAKLEFGDGSGGFAFISVPAPADALFLTSGQDNLIVVNPAATLLTNLQAAIAATADQGAVADQNYGGYVTPRGGIYGSQFFGGQLIQAKAPRRRVRQGA